MIKILSEYETYRMEPESLDVGTLNLVVKALREYLHQERVKTAELNKELEIIREICNIHLSKGK